MIAAEPDGRGPRFDRSEDPHQFAVFLPEGGWCWFQDPRAIIHKNTLLIGGVQGNGTGDAVVGVYDLKTRRQLGRVVLHEDFKRDDHNCPVFYVRPDGRVLAVYALHGNNRKHYYRISEPNDLLRWGEERRFEHDYPTAGNVTYMNLYPTSETGLLYNFFRGIEYNPSFVTSRDGGETWGTPTHFVQSELEGRHRPYARYAGNGTDTVHVCFTDGHPDRFGNSIYYAAFRGGNFLKADGTLIKSLSDDGPLRPSEAERLFEGGGEWAPEGPASADRAAWTSSVALDQQGRPHVAYSLHLTNEDHRYRIASWNGSTWIDREVAYAGHCLYETQTSYTGLIALDPQDPSVVVISTDVDPTTGQNEGGAHEIYRSRVSLDDDVSTVAWEPLTRNSPVSNLRPQLVSNRQYRVILWLRGHYAAYTDYHLDVVGIVETVE